MEESETTMADGEQEHIIAAAYHIVKALATVNTTMTDDVRRTLTELEFHLSRMTKIGDGEEEKTREIENKLKFTQNTIVGFQTKHLKIWDDDTAAAGGNESMEYLQAVDEVRKLAEDLAIMEPQQEAMKAKELVKRARNIQQMAMVKLQEELFQILAQHVQRLDNRCADEESMVSTEDSSFEEVCERERSSPEYDQYIVDLVHPQAIPLIRSIAQVMFDANYDQEFCQAFMSFWKQELSDYLTTLNFKQLSIEEVLKMEWKRLNCRIKNWCRTTKSVIGIYLTNEKRLFSRILGKCGSKNSASSSCFVEASKASVLCLLNFGQAVAVGPLRPERLFCLLDMYEVLSNLQPDVEDLFSGKEDVNGSLVRAEFQELRNTLGDSAKAILLQLGNQIASKTSTTPFTNGGIHHLTKYVMNYIILLEEYGDTINSLLDERNGVSLRNTSSREEEEEEEEVTRTVSSSVSSPVAHLLQSAASMLEANLDAKSDLYRDEALKHIFMMNNIHYMVQKIEKSQVRAYFGDEWIRKHIAKFRQHATTYERIAWRSILSLLKHDGNKGKAILKQKCRDFSTAFEELYKSQTGWLIPDVQLRGELRIKTSQKVIHGYRPFAGRIRESIGDKYIKYTEEDLGNHIWDLFEGSPKSLNHQRRR